MTTVTDPDRFEIKLLRFDTTGQKSRFLELMADNLAPKDKRWLEWKYLENPWRREPVVYAAVDAESGEIAGMRPFMVQRLAAGERVFPAAQPCDTVIDPRYRGLGLFRRMNEAAIREIGGEFPVFFNFPNQYSRPGNLRAGWREVALLDESLAFGDFRRAVKISTGSSFFAALSLPVVPRYNGLPRVLNRLGRFKSSGVDFRSPEEFDEAYERLWAEVEPRLRVVRTTEYLRWRFLLRPDQDYQVWAARTGGDLLGYLVLAFGERWGLNEARVVDYQYREEEPWLALLGQALEEARHQRECKLASVWAFTEPGLYQRLRDLGFVNRTQYPFSRVLPRWYMLARVNDPAVLSADYGTRAENWALRPADKDAH